MTRSGQTTISGQGIGTDMREERTTTPGDEEKEIQNHLAAEFHEFHHRPNTKSQITHSPQHAPCSNSILKLIHYAVHKKQRMHTDMAFKTFAEASRMLQVKDGSNDVVSACFRWLQAQWVGHTQGFLNGLSQRSDFHNYSYGNRESQAKKLLQNIPEALWTAEGKIRLQPHPNKKELDMRKIMFLLTPKNEENV